MPRIADEPRVLESTNGPSGPGVATPGVIEELREAELGERTDGWIVTVYDNEFNTYEEVMAILIIATRCTPDEAFIEAWEIDHLGKSVVHLGSQNACLGVAQVICTIGIKVEVSRE